MNERFVKRIAVELEEIKTAGLFKNERIITVSRVQKLLLMVKQWLIFALIITWDYRPIQKLLRRRNKLLINGATA